MAIPDAFGTNGLSASIGDGVRTESLLDIASADDNSAFLGLVRPPRTSSGLDPLASELQRLSTWDSAADNNSSKSHQNTIANHTTSDSTTGIDLLTGSALHTLPVSNTELDPLTGTQFLASSLTSEELTSQSVSPMIAIMAEGTLTMYKGGDFDGNPIDPSDDALIYAARGFTLNEKPILPVQRDANGNAIQNQAGKFLLIDKAVTVAEGYTVSSAPGNQYANLLPPQVVEKQTVTVPAYVDVKQQELARRIPSNAATVTFNAQQNPINDASQWASKFPTPGTASQPTVVRVTNGELRIPANVNLDNYVITVESGNITFNASGHNLNNVVLVTNNGNVNLVNVRSSQLSVFASGSLSSHGTANFAGSTWLANGSSESNITFHGVTTGADATDNLKVISQGNIIFHGATDTHGTFSSVKNLTFNNQSTFLGAIGAKGNILFNGKANVTAVAPDTAPPVITAGLARDTAIGGTTNLDQITADPTITGRVTDASPVTALRAGFDNTPSGSYVNVLTQLRADGSFTLSPTQLAQVYGGTLTDGLHTLHLQAQDQYGNVSGVFDIPFTLDTQSAAPTGLDLLAASDTGLSSSDQITNVTTPTITGTAEAGSLVQLFSDGQLVSQTTATATNTWNITTNNLSNATYTLTATATDLAGNVSSASTQLDVVIDTLVPTAPNKLRLTPSTDTGDSNNDNITSNTTPTIQGTGEASALIRLFKAQELVGQTTSTADGGWQISSSTLSNGEHTFTATAEDRAGNVSASSGQLVVNIETQPDAQTQSFAQIYGLDPYPDAISLVPGTTRQLSVQLNGLTDSPDLTNSSAGTQYSVSDSNVLSVSSDGLVTALSSGAATVTVKYGEAQVIIPVQVEAAQSGPVTVGTDGGIVQASDGSMVALAPGALSENTTVSLTPLSTENLSLPVPQGFEVAGAFNLEMGDDALSVAAQLAIPAPVLPVGTEVFFMRKGALPDETGTWNPIWLQEESGVVGADGMIRTSSPPYPGIFQQGEYLVAYSSPTGSATLVEGQLTLNYNFPLAFFGIIIPGNSRRQNFGQLLNPSNFVTTSAFSVSYNISSVQVIAVPTVGLPVVTTVGVQLNSNGLASFEANLNIPAPTAEDPMAPPVLQQAELKFQDAFNQPFPNNQPVVFLTGSNVLVNNSVTPLGSSFNDLLVNFYVGNQAYQGTVIPTLSSVLPSNQFQVAVGVPDTIPLGVSRIVLSRRQNEVVGVNSTGPVYSEVQSASNEIRLVSGGEYVLAALRGSDRITVMDGTDPESVVQATGSNSSKLLLASIPVGTTDREDSPRALAVTNLGNRVYVPLEGSGRVALVDPLVLQQVDTQSLTSGVNPIELPSGARPRSIVISPRDEYAYIADAASGKIYVLDIDPFSATYHQVTQTILVTPATTGLRQMAMSSDGRKLFVAAPASSTSQILVVNIDPLDRPQDLSVNPRKWHEQIKAISANSAAEGVAATDNPLIMTFTNSRADVNGFGVLEVTNNDPLNFAATTRYAALGLGSVSDYFDVNNAVAVKVMRDASYAFVVGRNAVNFGQGVESIDGVRAGSNIGIIKNPLGPTPQLVAATRPIPKGYTTDLVLSNDNKYLYASYPTESGGAGGSVQVFDIEEIINTLNTPGSYQLDQLNRGIGSPFFQSQSQRAATSNDFKFVPIDDINPSISIAADYEILQEDRPRNQFTYGVPSNTTRGPIGTGGSPFGMAVTPADWLDLSGPGATTSDLTPTFEWQFDAGMENVREVNLFVSTFSEGQGLLPGDRVVDLSDPSLLPTFSQQQKRELLTEPWNGYSDFNPNRILTATWKRNNASGGGTWNWGDGIEFTSSTPTTFTLGNERTLTAGQTYHWAVQAVSSSGTLNTDVDQFNTVAPTPLAGGNTFSSVSVLTHGFKLPTEPSGIPSSFYEMAGSIASAGGGGLLMRYSNATGNWVSVDAQGGVLTSADPSAFYGKPLVLLTDWSKDNESAIPDSGFAEAAADAFFASMVQLDQKLGGTAGFDPNTGNFNSTTGAIFNSPLHFIGFSRGAVVNSEIIQRLGTYFPSAGGMPSGVRDLQMTTIDPHDFEQPGFSLIGQGFSDFHDPEIQVWGNVTFADNYYQTVPKLDPSLLELTGTPSGRSIPNADLNVFLGTRAAEPNYQLSRAGFTRETDPLTPLLAGQGATHGRVMTWYGGTADLGLSESPDQIYRRRGDGYYQHLFDQSFYNLNQTPRFNPWYTPDHSQSGFTLGAATAPWEGIGTGWFYSVLGGGKDLRPPTAAARVSVNFDNTADDRMRGDYPVPTVFNGNFDVVTTPNSPLENFINSSNAIPGWSLHNNDASAPTSLPTTGYNVVNANRVVDLAVVAGLYPSMNNHLQKLGNAPTTPGYKPDYALELLPGETAVHNYFRVFDEGVLRFDLFVPDPDGGQLKVSMTARDGTNYDLGSSNWPAIKLQTVSSADYRKRDTIGYGKEGFETFHLEVPKDLRGKEARLSFQLPLGSGTDEIYLDNIAIGSVPLTLGNPTEAKDDTSKHQWNYLIEKPQYTLSYNSKDGYNSPNWASWQLNKSWLGNQVKLPRPSFTQDPLLAGTSWYQVDGDDYTNANFTISDPTRTIPQAVQFVRGHVVNSEDRSRHLKDNYATYLGTNIVPQENNNNSVPWRLLEDFSRKLVEDKNKELYIMAGSYGTMKDDMGNNITLPATTATNRINTPANIWKVIVVMDKPGQGLADINTNTKVIAVNMPNVEPQLTGVTTPKYKTWYEPAQGNIISARTLENILNADPGNVASGIKYNFLSNVPQAIQDVIENQTFTFVNNPLDAF